MLVFLLGSMFSPRVVDMPSTFVTRADRKMEAAPLCEVRSFLFISSGMSHGVVSLSSVWADEKR